MSNVASHIYIEGDKFFFDSEIYTQDGPAKTLDYEDGDMIKWVWEGKKMMGILRDNNVNLGLFSIENVIIQ
jgi:hypothetical protein